VTPEEIADAFAQWAVEENILGSVTEDQTRLLAKAFGAGAVYVLKQVSR
jgi:hypothetical protein